MLLINPTGRHVATDEDAPKVHENEQDERQHTMDGKYESEEVIRDALGVTIDRVERMRCEWGRNLWLFRT
jgi:hypothetical protein